uniref:Uncharacterized protein n=1 Tax=Knipowitschia caucasica TaxID=637954 RepID=A0AAV2KV12_KNICA
MGAEYVGAMRGAAKGVTIELSINRMRRSWEEDGDRRVGSKTCVGLVGRVCLRGLVYGRGVARVSRVALEWALRRDGSMPGGENDYPREFVCGRFLSCLRWGGGQLSEVRLRGASASPGRYIADNDSHGREVEESWRSAPGVERRSRLAVHEARGCGRRVYEPARSGVIGCQVRDESAFVGEGGDIRVRHIMVRTSGWEHQGGGHQVMDIRGGGAHQGCGHQVKGLRVGHISGVGVRIEG